MGTALPDRIVDRFAAVDARFGDLEKRMDAGFARVDDRFAAVDNRFADMQKWLDAHPAEMRRHNGLVVRVMLALFTVLGALQTAILVKLFFFAP